MVNHRIKNLVESTTDLEAVNLRTLNKYVTKPSDHTNRFAYPKAPITGLQQCTDLIADSIELTKVDEVATISGNYHSTIKR